MRFKTSISPRRSTSPDVPARSSHPPPGLVLYAPSRFGDQVRNSRRRDRFLGGGKSPQRCPAITPMERSGHFRGGGRWRGGKGVVGSCPKRGVKSLADSGAGWSETGMGRIEKGGRADRFLYPRPENRTKGLEKGPRVLDPESQAGGLVGGGGEFSDRLAQRLVEEIDRRCAKKRSLCFGG